MGGTISKQKKDRQRAINTEAVAIPMEEVNHAPTRHGASNATGEWKPLRFEEKIRDPVLCDPQLWDRQMLGRSIKGKEATQEAGRQKREDRNHLVSALCNPQLRDPLTIAISFMHNPGLFRGACTFTRECWEQALYFETRLSCPHIILTQRSDPTSTICRPISLASLDVVPIERALGVEERCHLRQLAGSNAHATTDGSGSPVKPKEFKVEPLPQDATEVQSIASLEHPGLWEKVWKQFVPHDLPAATNQRQEEAGLLISLQQPELRCYYSTKLFVCELVLASGTLETIGNSFLSECASLKIVTVRDMSALKTVGDSWLKGCTALESVYFERLPKLKAVGNAWLENCSSLTHFSLCDAPELTTVRNDWLRGCSSLRSTAFERLPKLREVGEFWLRSCSGLREFTLCDLLELKTVGYSWLRDCTALETVCFVNLPKLSSIGGIGGSWLYQCTSLQVAEFRDLPELEAVGNYWMYGCSSLVTLKVECAPKLHGVPNGCFGRCTSLRDVTAHDVPQVTNEFLLSRVNLPLPWNPPPPLNVAAELQDGECAESLLGDEFPFRPLRPGTPHPRERAFATGAEFLSGELPPELPDPDPSRDFCCQILSDSFGRPLRRSGTPHPRERAFATGGSVTTAGTPRHHRRDKAPPAVVTSGGEIKYLDVWEEEFQLCSPCTTSPCSSIWSEIDELERDRDGSETD